LVSWSQRSRRLLAAAAIGTVVTGVCAWGLVADRLDGVQNVWEDRLQPGLASSVDVVVVGIDSPTLIATQEAWPWPRDLHAELLDRIGDGDPAVVLYDVLFADRGRGDSALVDAMGRTPTVLPTSLTLTAGEDGPPRIVNRVTPTAPLAAAAAGLGHANINRAGDTGVVRTLPLYALDEREFARPSVALAAVSVADGATGPLTERPGGVQVGDRFIPLDDAELRINWSTTLEQQAVIPAIDVLSGAVDAETFRDRVVLVGVTDPTLGDQQLVPIDRSGSTSGVVVLANAVNTILSSGYLGRPSTAAQLGLIVVATAAVTALFASLRLVPALLGALGVAAGVIGFVAWRFHTDGKLWNLVWPVLAVFLAVGAGTVWRYFTEVRHRRRAWRLFSTYVPAQVVRQLEDPARLASAVSGVRGDVTVVFADVRDFTPLTTSLPPARVRELLDRYYEYLVTIVQRHRGTVMQFVGDEVFAVFGVPVADDTMATEALRSVLEMQAEIAALDDRLAAAELPAIRFGIGVHYGTVVAAHVGAENRRQYAVVGEAVNIGARLCDRAEAGQILVSDRAWSAAAAEVRDRFAAAGSIELKGVAVPVTVYRSSPVTPYPPCHDSADESTSAPAGRMLRGSVP
jgi:adenylate cyclase